MSRPASVAQHRITWRFSAKTSAAWQPRRHASAARAKSGALSGSSRPMKGPFGGSGLPDRRRPRTMRTQHADRAKKIWARGPATWREHGRGGQLYVVATPIGNLEDISPRALESLARATRSPRRTRASRRGCSSPIACRKIMAVHEHNERRAADSIVAQLAQGKTVALVTDAGTPAISDPGATVVKKARAADSRWSRSRPNAAVTALSASGIADGPFLFAGFFRQDLPKGARRSRGSPGCRTRLSSTRRAPRRRMRRGHVGGAGPERTLVIARELTKLFEQIHRCGLGEAADWLRADTDRGAAIRADR